MKICCSIEMICVFISCGTFFYGMYNKTFSKYNSKVLYQIRSVKKASTYQAIGKYFILFYVILLGLLTIIEMFEGEFDSNCTLVFFLVQALILSETYDTGATICEEGLIVGYSFVKWEQINSHMWLSSYSKDKSMSELKFNLNNKKGKPSLRQTFIKVRKQQEDEVGKIINEYLN